MRHNSCEVDCCFNTGVSAADNSYMFSFEQRSITVWTVRYPFISELIFPGNADFTPTGTCGEDNGFTLQDSTVFQFNFNEVFLFQTCSTLQIHDINVVIFHMLFKVCCEFWTFCAVKTDKEGPKLAANLEEHVKDYNIDVMNLQRD